MGINGNGIFPYCDDFSIEDHEVPHLHEALRMHGDDNGLRR